ncbi:MAG: hypothetical protein ACKO7W_18960 [Elainella sp.]
MKILEDRPYSFSQIFELNVSPADLVPDLGYRFERAFVELPIYRGELNIEPLHQEFQEVLPYTDLDNEQARRETIVSSIAKFLVRRVKSRLSYEYPLKTAKLFGTLDYLLQKPPALVIIEAKRDDMENGFNQLAAQLVAFDQWTAAPPVDLQPILLGAVTTGTLWQFGRLFRSSQQVQQILNSYRVPEDLEALLRILLHALE